MDNAGRASLGRILHVEDNRADARLLQEALRDLPVEVEWASTLADATDRVSTSPGPDLVVVDVAMPDGSGIAWLARHKTKVDFPPTVVFSASQDPFRVRQAYEAGANAYVNKPAGASAYLEAVRSMWTFWRFAARV